MFNKTQINTAEHVTASFSCTLASGQVVMEEKSDQKRKQGTEFPCEWGRTSTHVERLKAHQGSLMVLSSTHTKKTRRGTVMVKEGCINLGAETWLTFGAMSNTNFMRTRLDGACFVAWLFPERFIHAVSRSQIFAKGFYSQRADANIEERWGSTMPKRILTRNTREKPWVTRNDLKLDRRALIPILLNQALLVWSLLLVGASGYNVSS